MEQESFRCFLVERPAATGDAPGSGPVRARVTTRAVSDLPAGEVLVRVRWSALNYKDALAATGHPGVVKRFPHVPGIDAAGVVVESRCDRFAPGQEVLVNTFDLGAGCWGGWAELIRVPAEWVVPLPAGLSLRESMIYGTAGLTAVLCIDRLQEHGLGPDAGPIVVTGATGGVGCMAVLLLAKLGYQVVAVTGKACCLARRSTTTTTSRCSARGGPAPWTRWAAARWRPWCAKRGTAAA
jgi:acrylyl-CoA reductase (NADPH)